MRPPPLCILHSLVVRKQQEMELQCLSFTIGVPIFRGWAEQETRICIPVPAVPVQDIWQENAVKFVNLWFDFRKDIFPVYSYSESESNSLKSIQRITNFLAFFLPDILYRHCRNRNTNSWFLFRSPPIPSLPPGSDGIPVPDPSQTFSSIIFPNNIYRHTCYCLSSVKQAVCIV